MAQTILQFLEDCGLRVVSGFAPRDGVQVGEVDGPIPVAAVLDRYAGGGEHVVSINTLDVRPDGIRMLGPEWEEYRIVSSGNV